MSEWISAADRVPKVGKWGKSDQNDPGVAYRRAECVPVFLASGEKGWGEFWESTADNGVTVDDRGWLLMDSFNSDSDEVTHWFHLPAPPKKPKRTRVSRAR